MAAPNKSCGYQCKFLEQVNDEFFCKECKQVARELSVAVCCGHHFCKSCITPYQESNRPCPKCGQVGIDTVPQVRYQKKILTLKVSCQVEDRGCEWTGPLQNLDAHLSMDTGECQFVDVQCPNKCDQHISRCRVPDHLEKDCPKRDYSCVHCGFSGTYEEICNQHYPECEYYPICCPNECSVEAMKRNTLDHHLTMCPYQEVVCEVTGCGERVKREDMEKHMEVSTQKHISLMSATTQQELKQKDQVLSKRQQKEREMEKAQDDEKRKLQEKEKQIEALKAKVGEKEQQIQKCKVRIKTVEETVARHSTQLPIPPITFTSHNFAQLKAQDSIWTSPPFYTYLAGYKVCLKVWPNGQPRYSAHNKAVSVEFCRLGGEYDASLPPSPTLSITLQLLNQCRDRDHHTVTERLNEPTRVPINSQQDKELAIGLVFSFVGWLFQGSDAKVFINHQDLDNGHGKQYLKNDCLEFRVASVQL